VSAEARRQAPATCGHLRIYLGCAPGAGTTCALLGEGRQRAEHGTDVVVASVETHGRPGTEALLAGVEGISPPAVADRAMAVAGIDLGAILARSPQVALVDDLARSNAPGPGLNAAAVLALLDEAGSPATVASGGPRYFGFVTGGRCRSRRRRPG
jgi:K+-sensing histidine kinase KdpD